jgi:glycosyltransferase involved in cell wall biosynthesis
VEQGHPQALAEAIAWAVSHRGQLAEIGQNGRQLYDTHFSVRRLQEQMEHVLSHALLPT